MLDTMSSVRARATGISSLLAAATGAVYLAIRPRTADFAAQAYRTRMFGRLHFAAWDGGWYGGHHVPGYSVLFPPLGWALGPELAAALAAVVAAAAFAWLVDATLGPPAQPGAWWFATLGTASELFAGRLTFVLGMATGLTALATLVAGRRAAGIGLAALTGLVSPVAALFLALAGAAQALARRALPWAAVAIAALAPVLLLALLFPEGGREPFYRAFFVTTIGMTVAAALLLPRTAPRAVVAGLALYAIAVIGAFELSTPVGSNAARLGTLAAGPLLACVLLRARSIPRARGLLAAGVAAYALWRFPPWYERGALIGAALLAAAVLAPARWRLWPAAAVAGLAPFAIFQWSQTRVDLDHAASDPATHAAYFAPLLRFLDHASGPRTWRVEVPQMREHWEAVYVGERYPLARGWERQLDTRYSRLFYRPRARRAYRAWLEENAVRFVAVPDAPLDYASGREAAILRRPPRYLRPRARLAHWRVYQVVPHPRLVIPVGAARLDARALEPERVDLVARHPGSALVRVHYSRYWRLRGGCVRRAGDFTRISTRKAGPLSLTISVTADRLLGGERRCG